MSNRRPSERKQKSTGAEAALAAAAARAKDGRLKYLRSRWAAEPCDDNLMIRVKKSDLDEIRRKYDESCAAKTRSARAIAAAIGLKMHESLL